MLNYIPHHNQSLVFGCFGGLDKFVVEVVGADGVRQLAEVHLEQGGHRMNVLKHASIIVQIWHTILVKGHPVILKLLLFFPNCKSVHNNMMSFFIGVINYWFWRQFHGMMLETGF